jgi:hypothetical protein
MKRIFVMYREMFLQGGVAHCYLLSCDDSNRVESMTQIDNDKLQVEWGYTGSGPHALAHAILLHYTGDKGTADRYFRSFVHTVISAIPMELPLWFCTDKEIDGFLADAKRLGYTW